MAFRRQGVALGIGDDCALIAPQPGMQLAMSMDLLQEGIHFLPDSDPYLLGQRALLVNLSDLAAMGAEPLCFTLGLGLNKPSEAWLERFSAGLEKVAGAHDCPLVGGDLIATDPRRGAMTFCVQVHGQLPGDSAIRRSGARPGDLVFVTGTLGDAAAGLRLLKGELALSHNEETKHQHLRDAFFCPESRVQAGLALRGLASAAIDISDGLVSDLGHILRASAVGAVVELDALPLSAVFREVIPQQEQLSLAVAGGDDYELCFTAPAAHRQQLRSARAALGIALHCIGRIEPEPGLRWTQHNESVLFRAEGYNHFRSAGSGEIASILRTDE